QLAAMGSHFMGMLSIDASDASYQSFRSKTTLGLEMGSLVAGGYGAVKGVMAFNRLARMPAQASRLIRTESSISKSNKIWTATKRRTSVKNAFMHWQEHGTDFPELLNAKQYVEPRLSSLCNNCGYFSKMI
ncbi:MAG: hypothetical protein AABZ92_03205, partial [Verrucomicrobiota bacterium]